MPDPITALVVGGTTILSAKSQERGAEKGAEAQIQASERGVEEQRRQFDQLQALLKPYTEVGLPALEAQQAFLGLKGPEAQQAAIKGISEGETFKEFAKQGEEAILQRASATGGLRGGNIQQALAKFRPELLSSLIEQQYGKLGELTKIGQSSAAGVGSAGITTGTNIANLFGQQGAAIAGREIGTARAYSQALNLPAQILGFQYASGATPGFGNIF